MMNWIGIFAVGLALVMGGSGWVGLSVAEDQKKALLDLVKDRDQAIQDIVRSETKGETPEERTKLKAIVGGMFDFEAYARVCLGRYWAERTEAERQDFVQVNRQLIEKNYSNPALYTKADKIEYTEVELDGKEAVVKTEVFYKSETSTIDYQLHLVDGKWLIYDMMIDDLSIGKSNRSQFRKEIRKSSFDGLMKKLHKKLKEDKDEGKGGA